MRDLDFLLASFELEQLEPGRFQVDGGSAWPERIFGGQFLGQAVIAAGRTVGDDRVIHSLHGYFVRPGDPSAPLEYNVITVRDGRSFASRRVEATQFGDLRFVGLISFATPEEGLEYQPPADLGAVPPPDGLRTYGDWMSETTDRPEDHYETQTRPRPVDVRYVDPPKNPPREPVTAPQRMWLRVPGPLPDDPLIHAAALAYASDETLIDNSMLPHTRRWSDPDLQGASLDHAMWFLRPARADQWLLFEQTVVSTSGGRGLARGDLYTADGSFVATATQEGLLRLAGG